MQIEFDERDLVVLNDALIRLPYGQVAGLIEKINKQIAEQRNRGSDDAGTR